MQQPTELPPAQSPRTLVISLLVALVLAALVLVLAVLPAEYGLDYTGFGRIAGLTEMHRLSSGEKPDSAAPDQPAATQDPFRLDSITIELAPGEDLEYKVTMHQYAAIRYTWATPDDTPVYFDFHGEPKGAAADVFESFAIGTSPSLEGSFTAPFQGTHGWYWKNSGETPIVIELNIRGHYQVIGVLQ